MSSGAPAKLLANQQLTVLTTDGKTFGHVTFRASMAVMNYARYDSLISSPLPSSEIHYKVNLAQTIGGVNLALCDGGANRCIKSNDM